MKYSDNMMMILLLIILILLIFYIQYKRMRALREGGWFSGVVNGIKAGAKAATTAASNALKTGAKQLGGVAADAIGDIAQSGLDAAIQKGTQLINEQAEVVTDMITDPLTTEQQYGDHGITQNVDVEGRKQRRANWAEALNEREYGGEKVGMFCDTDKCGKKKNACKGEKGELRYCRTFRCKTPAENPNPDKWVKDGDDYVTKRLQKLLEDRHVRLKECYTAIGENRKQVYELALEQDKLISLQEKQAYLIAKKNALNAGLQEPTEKAVEQVFKKIAVPAQTVVAQASLSPCKSRCSMLKSRKQKKRCNKRCNKASKRSKRSKNKSKRF